MSELLKQLQEQERYTASLRSAVSLLSWDMRAFAPKGGRQERIRIIGDLSSEIFRRTSSEEYGALLKALKEPKEYEALSIPLRLTVDRRLEDWEENRRVPAEFQRELTTFRAECEAVWAEAREKNDYRLFAPWLERNVELTKKNAEYRWPGEAPYEAMLSRKARGMTLPEIDRLFEEYKTGILPLLPAFEANNAPVPEALFEPCPEEGLLAVQRLLLEYIGFDLSRGALGESPHPLTSRIHRNDVRLTNHLRPTKAVDFMFSAIHEGGHGIYDQNVSPEYAETAAENLIFSDVHESQSRFFENVLGHDPAFWEPVYPELQKLLPPLQKVSLPEFTGGINRVQRSYVRTEADEVTYGLHIVLRHELEKGLFSGKIPASEIREAWNDKTEALLGLPAPSDAEGVLQDLHWSSVYFGYFPTYLLGTLYDGMFAMAAEKELGSLSELLAAGKIKNITAWLNRNIHAGGSLYNGPELVRRLTGEPVSAKPMLELWKKRYL